MTGTVMTMHPTSMHKTKTSCEATHVSKSYMSVQSVAHTEWFAPRQMDNSHLCMILYVENAPTKDPRAQEHKKWKKCMLFYVVKELSGRWIKLHYSQRCVNFFVIPSTYHEHKDPLYPFSVNFKWFSLDHLHLSWHSVFFLCIFLLISQTL